MWNKLSIKDKANYIRLAVRNGVRDLSTIRDAYNLYAEGGPIDREDLIQSVTINPTDTLRDEKKIFL